MVLVSVYCSEVSMVSKPAGRSTQRPSLALLQGDLAARGPASAGGRIEIELSAAGSHRYGKIVFLPCAAETA
jgi:hypothetical protein